VAFLSRTAQHSNVRGDRWFSDAAESAQNWVLASIVEPRRFLRGRYTHEIFAACKPNGPGRDRPATLGLKVGARQHSLTSFGTPP
jgi:hypothetical protein